MASSEQLQRNIKALSPDVRADVATWQDIFLNRTVMATSQRLLREAGCDIEAEPQVALNALHDYLKDHHGSVDDIDNTALAGIGVLLWGKLAVNENEEPVWVEAPPTYYHEIDHSTLINTSQFFMRDESLSKIFIEELNEQKKAVDFSKLPNIISEYIVATTMATAQGIVVGEEFEDDPRDNTAGG